MLGRWLLCAAVLAHAPRAAAWSLSREAIRPALIAAQPEVRRCARAHAAPNGRYVFWIVVNAGGRGQASLRDSPAEVSDDARRCLLGAYEAQRYPSPFEASVAWSSNSPPGRTYSISLPIELLANRYGFDTPEGPLERGSFGASRVRPRPARSVPPLEDYVQGNAGP